ncbi:MAG TPA: hypothetical protein VME01_01005, partial [Solirubrobacteraceae bacterium]|nr:hypothetical protein [Solirubrobacteraceae bacterium]
MSSLASPQLPTVQSARARRKRLNETDRRANALLKWLAFAGGALIFIALIAIAYQVIDGATGAYDKYGLSFLAHKTWDPALGQFGGLAYIYGTLVSSILSLVLATILGVSIGLFLSLMAPRRVAMIIGPLVEMLAAIPSVVLGLIGIYLLCPFVKDIEPALHSALGFIPLFGDPQSPGNSMFAATLVLTIMVVPIIAALT